MQMKRLLSGLPLRKVVAFIAAVAMLQLTIAQSPAAQPELTSPPAPGTARAEAPFDLSGYWVAIVTQDWRFRMVVPGKGEYIGIPINPAAKQFADAWTPAADEATGQECKAYGAGAIMRVPERLHITWQDDNTLRVETDAGMQTRLLQFTPPLIDPSTPSTTQGVSVASWVFSVGPRGGPRDPAVRGPGLHPPGEPEPKHEFGTLKVMTSHLSAGYLRKNGVPYSTETTMTEYWDLRKAANGEQWLTVPTELDDPQYLQSPYDFTPIFKREADGSKWSPSPCSLRW